ncbi:MAG: hypothetical protein ABI946_11880 [Chthoniobacterales bacterium]
MKLQIPEPLRLREEAICTALRGAAETGGDTGEAAGLLEAILLPHLEKERMDVLQPLGLLSLLARGEVSSEMLEVLPQIDQLKNDLHGLQVEHATILSAIKRFVAAARAEGKTQHARFAERLLFRAWLDESVFTPLVILIGKYLRRRLTGEDDTAAATQLVSSELVELRIPESLQLSHAQLNAALLEAMQAGGQTMIAAEVLAQLLEPHLHKEDREVLRILGLLAPLAANRIDLAAAEDVSEWDELEKSERFLHDEHTALIAAAEKLRTIAGAEDAHEVLDFAERLLLRIRLVEEVFYPAALLIRNYVRLRSRNRLAKEAYIQ